MRNLKTRKLTQMAMLTAISIVLVYLIHFPIFPVAPFLDYDPADIPIFVGTLLFGPWGGLALTALVSVIQGLTVSAASGPIGILMHFFATGSFVLAAGFLCRNHQSKGRVAFGLAAGTVTWTIAMVLWNLILTPIFWGLPVQAVLDIMVPAIIPFNLIKGGGNAVIAFLVYFGMERIQLTGKNAKLPT